MLKKNVKLILFNGPPRSGKDTAADYIRENYKFTPMSLASELKNSTHRLYNIGDVSFDHFEDVKDEPNDLLLGLTPRQAYINVAEKLLKPVHGETYFARSLYNNRIKDINFHANIVITDLGFQEELDFLKTVIEPSNIFTIKMFRKGFDFSNDSRSYVYAKDSPYLLVENNSSLDDLYKHIDEFMAETVLKVD